MKNVNWGIEGYLVLFDHKVIGQFDNCGWAVEFQQMVSHMRPGRPVGMLYTDGHSVIVTERKEEETCEGTTQSNDEQSK